MKKKSRLSSLVTMAAMMCAMSEGGKYNQCHQPKRKRNAPVLPSDKNPVRKKTVFSIKGQEIEAYSRKDALKIYAVKVK